MIIPKKIPLVKENVEFLENQVIHFKNKFAEETKIVSKGNTSEEEKSRILSLIDSHLENIPKISQQVEDIKTMEDLRNIEISEINTRLHVIDEILYQLQKDIEVIIREQIHCSLENYRRELIKSIISVRELFDFLNANIKSEINFLRKFYRIPSNASNTIIPELEELLSNLGNYKITLKDFIYGYKKGEKKVEGYEDLRSKNNVFSRYQYYENSPEIYDEINGVIRDICRAIWPFLSEQRTEPEFKKLFTQIEEINRKAANPKKRQPNIRMMKDVFEFNQIFRTLIIKVGKKFSYREEYKNTKATVIKFNELQKSIITYHEEAFQDREKKLIEYFAEKNEKENFERIINETKRYMKEKTLPFDRIDMIFFKLMKKDFNIVIQEKEADDLTIKITPHLAEKFGENNLKKNNIIILEIDFWFPYENKQWMFEEMSQTIQKIQADEPVDTKEFMDKMQSFDKELEIKYRKPYPDKIKLINAVFNGYIKTFATKIERTNLNNRFMDKEAWNEVSSRLLRVKKNLTVLTSKHESLSSHINKFPFLKNAMEEICQLTYDLSMQLFILYEMADQRSVINMTNILSTYNEFHDIKSLWQAFCHYYNQKNISNFYANETKIIRLTQNFLCKNQLDKLFPKKKAADAD